MALVPTVSERRDLAIVGLLIGLLGGALILASSLEPIGRLLSGVSVGDIVSSVVNLLLGLIVLFSSLLIYRGRYSTGGLLNLFLGIVVIVFGRSFLGGVLTIVSGIVGLLANEARR